MALLDRVHGVRSALGLPAPRLPRLQLALVTFDWRPWCHKVIVKFSDITKGVRGISFDKAEAPSWFPGDQD